MRLLTHTIRNYFLLSAILLLLSVPAFYFVIHELLIREFDEELLEHKADFYQSIPHIRSSDDLIFYELLNKEFSLERTDNKIQRDSIYSQELYDVREDRLIPYRILRSGIRLNGQHYELLVKESMIGTKELVVVIVVIITVILIMLLIGFVFVNRFIAKKLWSPFYQTLQKLKSYEVDKNPMVEVNGTTITEFKDLNEAIRLLTERNFRTFNIQKEFTENAAHELQTPIAICRSKLELLMQTKELTEEQAELVSSLYDATDRISRLNKNLLLLSRIENNQYTDKEPVDLPAVISKCLGIHQPKLHRKNITLTSSLESAGTFRANPVLLEVMINNLISNAVRYTPEGGSIHIETLNNILSISNTGELLQEPDKIFHRFHRESRNTYGSGLGLAIVKKICDVKGYDLTYNFIGSRHTFRVSF